MKHGPNLRYGEVAPEETLNHDRQPLEGYGEGQG